MKDEAGIDDKIVAVCMNDPRMEEITALTSIPKHQLREIEEFFNTYKYLEQGKTTQVIGWRDKIDALNIIKASIEFYNSPP